jgi:hypothetical protein
MEIQAGGDGLTPNTEQELKTAAPGVKREASKPLSPQRETEARERQLTRAQADRAYEP